jgi:hypothetical protein
MTISYGDNVKILNSDKTDELGLSGKIGEVLGETSPSSTGVKFIGDAKDDYVVNVAFEDPNAEFWFTPDLLEIIVQEETTAKSTHADENSGKKWWQVWIKAS